MAKIAKPKSTTALVTTDKRNDKIVKAVGGAIGSLLRDDQQDKFIKLVACLDKTGMDDVTELRQNSDFFLMPSGSNEVFIPSKKFLRKASFVFDLILDTDPPTITIIPLSDEERADIQKRATKVDKKTGTKVVPLLPPTNDILFTVRAIASDGVRKVSGTGCCTLSEQYLKDPKNIKAAHFAVALASTRAKNIAISEWIGMPFVEQLLIGMFGKTKIRS
jgi:hypothetical protein